MSFYKFSLYIFSNKGEITAETLSSASIFVLCGSREKFTGSEVRIYTLYKFISSMRMGEYSVLLVWSSNEGGTRNLTTFIEVSNSTPT